MAQAAKKPAIAPMRIDNDDGPRWLHSVVAALVEQISQPSSGVPQLFPKGVDLIEISIVAGPASAPHFQISAKIAGPDKGTARSKNSQGGDNGRTDS